MQDDIRQYHNQQSDPDKAICDTLYVLISKHLKGAEPKVWHAHPVWFIEGNPIVGYSKLKNCVRLLFWSGQSFDEPELSPEGKFKAAECRYTSPEQVDAKSLKRWLAKAKGIQWDYKNIVKRKGELIRLS